MSQHVIRIDVVVDTSTDKHPYSTQEALEELERYIPVRIREIGGVVDVVVTSIEELATK